MDFSVKIYSVGVWNNQLKQIVTASDSVKIYSVGVWNSSLLKKYVAISIS